MPIDLGPTRRLVALALVAVCLSACRGDAEPAATPAADDVPGATKLQPAWTAGLDAIGQPIVSGDTAVVVEQVRGDELDIVGLDVASGEARWRFPYSPGFVPTGVGIRPVLATARGGAEYVVFQSPERKPEAFAPLLAVDPASGRVVRRTARVSVRESLGDCPDGFDVCSTILRDSGAPDRRLRWSLGTGRLSLATGSLPPGARGIGDGGLYSTGARPGERIGRRAPGVDWSLPAYVLFGSEASSDYGWAFELQEKAGRYVGSIGTAHRHSVLDAFEAGRRVEEHLYDRLQLVSFRAGTGRIEWASTGVTECGDGVDFAGPVRCRLGGVVVSKKGWDEPRFADMSLTVEGYDRRTGETTWSVAASARQARDLVQRRFGPVIRDGRHLVVRTQGGPVLVDARDGDSRSLGRDDRFLCEGETVEVRYAMEWQELDTRSGGRRLFVCDARGVRVEGPPTPAALRAGATRAGDLWLLTTNKGVLAYAR